MSSVEQQHGVVREAEGLGPAGPGAETEAQCLLKVEVEWSACLPLSLAILVLNELPAELKRGVFIN